ncbi:thioredoxin domain-containing protein [Nitratireductor basaltis]|uniref:Spermatogenesis-associated protein 20-like TRX domain-containing protein n=1 Tax=Nitratireductor basaltis TaxID=472175 RepID=A0A084U6D0_9HYPH|nr:thioredoxin domain-containing protein [Nitratireductor basaltis]KFB08516.1 hypothetical protein EL18_02767 [Nitratireductor basaltis]
MENENLLDREGSLYLRQHKDNPVHWRPWGEQALEEARELNKPILLSVGYSACHWCHVMAHECFEDAEVAALMNANFINVKVDREERGDIDQTYMAALGAMGEQGGWPLTMFLTPDAKPFWGGTYFPKHARYGRPGFMDVLQAVNRAWSNERDKLVNAAAKLHDYVRSTLAPQSGWNDDQDPDELLIAMAERIKGMSDTINGGLKGAPKFPNAPFLYMQWMHWLEHGDVTSRDHVLQTWSRMLRGGIYDHVAGGMARYSTDALWMVPHFEKMLYDNSYLIDFMTHCYTATGDQFFKSRCEETVQWLVRDMTTKDGAFAASMDADSEGGEGSYYTWTQDEIEEALAEERDAFGSYFDLAAPTGWEGDPILLRKADSVEDETLGKLRKQLLARRSLRTPPGRDDKILVDWNGMAIASLARAGTVFGNSEWVKAAERAYAAILAKSDDHRLPHVILQDGRVRQGLSSDFASMMSAALAFYSSTAEETYLHDATRFAAVLREDFLDEQGTGYFLQAKDRKDIPLRIRGDADEAVLSATAQIILALSQLAAVTGNLDVQEHVDAVAVEALSRSREQAYGRAGIIFAATMARTQYKLLLPAQNTTMRGLAARLPDLRRIDVRVAPGTATMAAGMELIADSETAYLCQPTRCLPPLRGPEALETKLRDAIRVN